MKKPTKKKETFRSSETGLYVTPEFAKKNPKITVKETDKKPSKKK